MSAALVARGSNTPVRSRSTEILCAGSLSIVVEGVDGEPPTTDEATEEVFEEDLLDTDACFDLNDEGNESLLSSPRGSRRGSRRGSTKEEVESKLAFFKTEAAARLSELEKLLDEHDQIVRELKRSESTGKLHVIGASESGSGFASAPIPGTPVEGSFPNPPSILISKTAPTSPAPLPKVHHPE